MDQRRFEILISHHQIQIPPPGQTPIPPQTLATLVTNLTYFGYALNEEGFAALRHVAEEDVEAWWTAVEGALVQLSGDDKPLAEHVVYKNFPGEVLSMSEADYWTRQVLMYWGLPKELVTTAPTDRPPLKEKVTLRVLQVAEPEALSKIYRSLLSLPARWTPGQLEEVRDLAPEFHALVRLENVSFAENKISLARMMLDLGGSPTLYSATDVLRLATAMSDGDVSLREVTKLRSFSRKERRGLLGMLERCKNLDEDVARRRERFKRLFRALRPGDYKKGHPGVVAAYDRVYRALPVETFNRSVEAALEAKDPKVLDLLASRPGEFTRRLYHCLQLFGAEAAERFEMVVPKLTTKQLLHLSRFLQTAHSRKHRVFPPRGNWSRLQVVPATPSKSVHVRIREPLMAAMKQEVLRRVSSKTPAVRRDSKLHWIKLQTSDSDLTPYGRGTVFPLPKNATFLRTASYWESGPTSRNLWYDNSWNFFDAKWKPTGVCCWNRVAFGKGAVFSGDPTNAGDLKGRACQLIDLYLSELRKSGVRYAVWSILCYSHKTFDDAEEVLGSLQWGDKPLEGKLFEPSRCHLNFAVRGASLTKYVAYIDLEKRQLVYMDANLPSRVSSAQGNGAILSGTMPAFLEYLDGIPSVADLLEGVEDCAGGVPFVYTDKEVAIHDESAFVFQPENQSNQFTPFDLNTLLT